MKVAVMGNGTVGKALVRILDCIDGIEVAYILELPDKCTEKRMVSDVGMILSDREVSLVVDALPAVHPSYEFMKKALESGKHVVTSNKAALCFGFRELMDLAKENNVTLSYEASCGGTIPCIREAVSLSASNEITACYGIMNGTTNFILDKMIREGAEFSDTLKEAQNLGYAEADPTADLSGYDVKNKIVILSNTAYHGYVTTEFPVCGIEKIGREDLSKLEKEGKAAKLLGISVRKENRYALGVVPVILPKESMEANVSRNFNIFTFSCSSAGDVKLYGQGAGGAPTADAMTRDILCVRDGLKKPDTFERELVYDPSLLSGKGVIGDENVSGTLEELGRKAAERGCFFAFAPDFL